MEKKDAGRIKSITTKTLSDFIHLEEGSTSKQNALKAGVVLGGSVLGQVLFSALESAEAGSVSVNEHINGSRHASWTPGNSHISGL